MEPGSLVVLSHHTVMLAGKKPSAGPCSVAEECRDKQASLWLRGCLLWNSYLDMNVVISIAVTVNPRDAFPTHSNLLVCLDPRGDL